MVNEISYIVTRQVNKQRVEMWLDSLGVGIPLHVATSGLEPWPHFANVLEVKKTLIAEVSYYKDKETKHLLVYKAGYWENGVPTPYQTGFEQEDGSLPDDWVVNDRTSLIIAIDGAMLVETGLRQCDFAAHREDDDADDKNEDHNDDSDKAKDGDIEEVL